MPISQNDYDKLARMQVLAETATEDKRKIDEFIQFLEEVSQRQDELMDLYQEDWMRLVEDENLDEAQEEALQALVSEGQYSVLDQDTIWNALEELSDAQVNLLKYLAAGL